MEKIILIVILGLTLTSCEKIIELDLNENASKIVIEANITNATGPYFVKINQSLPITNLESNPKIDSAFVTISDNVGNVDTLSSLGNGIYRTNSINGESGRTYTIQVVHQGSIYKAISTMPEPVLLDSINVLVNKFGGSEDFDFVPVFKDPSTIGDVYRFELKINSVLVKSHFIINDQVDNGKVNTQPLQNLMDIILTKGDTVSIQLQKVDKNVGLYFTILMLNSDTGPGGGTTPNNPPSNFTNGALGIFSAHTISEQMVVIQ